MAIIDKPIGSIITLVAVFEIAVAGAAHDGLCPLELELGVVTFAEGAVAVARQQRADFAQAHRLVGLGILAAGDVEGEARVGLLLDLDLERSAFGPEVLDILERLERRASGAIYVDRAQRRPTRSDWSSGHGVG